MGAGRDDPHVHYHVHPDHDSERCFRLWARSWVEVIIISLSGILWALAPESSSRFSRRIAGDARNASLHGGIDAATITLANKDDGMIC